MLLSLNKQFYYYYYFYKAKRGLALESQPGNLIKGVSAIIDLEIPRGIKLILGIVTDVVSPDIMSETVLR